MTYALANRPKVGGFPFLAECLRQAGVKHNAWSLPEARSEYVFEDTTITMPGTPLVEGNPTTPPFDQDALIAALRADQAGHTDFPEFLMAAWKAGVARYDVDFEARKVAYFGAHGESYEESYDPADIGQVSFAK